MNDYSAKKALNPIFDYHTKAMGNFVKYSMIRAAKAAVAEGRPETLSSSAFDAWEHAVLVYLIEHVETQWPLAFAAMRKDIGDQAIADPAETEFASPWETKKPSLFVDVSGADASNPFVIPYITLLKEIQREILEQESQSQKD